MSGKRPGQKPSKKKVDPEKVAAKRERREQAKALREAQRRKEQRKKMLIQVGVIAVVAILALTVTYFVMKGNEPDYAASPEGFDDDGIISVGNPDAPVTVTLIEDFQCPFCAAVHAETKDLLEGYAEGDDVRLEYHPIAFLDEMSTTEYSTRALNAAACVVEDDPANWGTMHDSLLENQPAEGSSGLDDATLVDMAVAAGADRDTVEPCIEDRANEDWIEYSTFQVTDADDFAGTPAIFVNGQRIKNPNSDAIESAVQNALGS